MSGDQVESGTAEFGELPGDDETPADDDPQTAVEEPVVTGEYTWKEFMREYGYDGDIETAYRDIDPDPKSNRLFSFFSNGSRHAPGADDWERVEFSPATYLGCPPDALPDRLRGGTTAAARFADAFERWIIATPVTKDEYTWEHFKWEYYYDDDGQPPRTADGDVEPFEPEEYLGFDPDAVESVLREGTANAEEMLEIEDRRTVDVNPELDEDEFFSTIEGHTTVVNRYDLEKAVPMEKKRHFIEEQRYWVDKPFAFIIVFHSTKENEKKYYAVEPYLNEIEEDLIEFFSGKLRTSIKYSDEDVVVRGSDADRSKVLEEETEWLIDRYELRKPPANESATDTETETSVDHVSEAIDDETTDSDIDTDASTDNGDTDASTGGGEKLVDRLKRLDLADVLEEVNRLENGGLRTEFESLVARFHDTEQETDEETTEDTTDTIGPLDGIAARPEPAVLAEDSGRLTEYQVEKVLRRIRRDFVGYERIDPIKHDINVEDISCDGYNSPVFVYHTDYENLITNVEHGERRLDNFVIKLAQRSGKGISKRQPQVDATLPDGSRAQLTLGKEVSDHGTNYTIRQFKDVPFTPVDLINWNTFSLDEMAFLWLCIESNKSLIFAGGTASGKTTSLNAVSLFIPSNTKIVSIEDTREVELPQRNWVASVTRPSFTQDNTGDVDEFDLLEAALRQRPDYIVMGEVRGEEGRTLFQVMSTGHTTYTTFHADTVDEVLKRFTTDPINVSKTLFTALDLISVQTQTKVQGNKVRRNKTITEINAYDAENDEVSVQDVYQWQPEQDEFMQYGDSKKLQEIAFDRGWTPDELDEQLFKRRTILAYLITNGLNEYTEVAATLQAFINDPDTILTLIANEQLEDSLEDLREMESVLIDIDPEKEALVPRPDPSSETFTEAERILEEADERVFEAYRGREAGGLVDALSRTTEADDIAATGEERQVLAAVGDDATAAMTSEDAGPTPDSPRGDEPVPDGEATDRSTSEPRAGDGDGPSGGQTDEGSERNGDGATDKGGERNGDGTTDEDGEGSE